MTTQPPPDPTPAPDSPGRTVPPGDLGADEAARLLAAGLSDASSRAVGDPPLPPAEVAASFPDLEVLEVLGQGGMGVVYKARQRRLDRLVALKVVSRELSQDPAFAERFTREARTLARLQHPHIVGVHDFGEAGGLHYLVMEYVEGVTLRHLMETQTLTPREALAIVPQICDALQYAHDAGVVHRDVKPENILLDRNGRVRVADFGLAKLTARTPGDVTLTGTNQVMGTMQYMAPEQYRTPQDVDHRADIFSLGVVFYEMLTGELPVGRFHAPSEGVDLDTRIDEIVMRALEREREERFQTADDVKSEIHTVTSSAAAAEDGDPSTVLPRHGDRRRARPAAREGGDARPWSRLVIWAAALIPVAVLVGWSAYVLVTVIAEDGDDRRFYAAISGWWAAFVVVCAALLLAVIAIPWTSSRRETVRGRGTAWGVGLLALVGGIVCMVGVDGAISDRQRAINWRRMMRTGVMDPRPPPRPHGTPAPMPLPRVDGAASPGDVTGIQAGILAAWNDYLDVARDADPTPMGVYDLYTYDDGHALRALEGDALEQARTERRLGMAMIGSEDLVEPPWAYGITYIQVSDWNRKARVSVAPRRGAGGVVIHFPMARHEGAWRFVLGPVTFSKR